MSSRLVAYDDPRSLGFRLRSRRIAPLVDLIEQIYERVGSVRIIDLGGRRQYWNIVSREVLVKNAVSITLVNLPGEKAEPDDDIFRHRSGNACALAEFADHSFDIVHSNSVIEHVGGWREMKAFAAEVHRLAPAHFVQTPYFWFPVEPHFLKPFVHWLPRPLRVSLFMKMRMGQRGRANSLDEAIEKVENSPILLDQRSFRLLFPGSRLIRERYLGLVKSLIAFRPGNET